MKIEYVPCLWHNLQDFLETSCPRKQLPYYSYFSLGRDAFRQTLAATGLMVGDVQTVDHFVYKFTDIPESPNCPGYSHLHDITHNVVANRNSRINNRPFVVKIAGDH